MVAAPNLVDVRPVRSDLAPLDMNRSMLMPMKLLLVMTDIIVGTASTLCAHCGDNLQRALQLFGKDYYCGLFEDPFWADLA